MNTSRDDLLQTVLKPESTLGAGNCAFNAFVLGLCRPEIFSGIERGLTGSGLVPDEIFEDFIERAAFVLRTGKNWAAVRDEILRLKQTNKVLLQQQLAAIMRQIAIEHAEINREHFERTRQSLLAAFHDFACRALNISAGRVKDDIYIKHPFIVRKFEELADKIPQELFSSEESDFDAIEYNDLKSRRSLGPVEKERLESLELQLDIAMGPAQHELMQWWEQSLASSSTAAPRQPSGYETFLAAMKQDGQWAGDLELAELARYFNVNLDVDRPDYDAPHHMHIDYGAIPAASREFGYALAAPAVEQLVSRDIVNNPSDKEAGESLQLLPLDHASVEARLSAVPDINIVIKFINSYKNGESLKKVPVPDAWSDKCIEQLLKRNVINRVRYETGLLGYEFVVSHHDAMNRIREMEQKDRILAAWDQAHKESPTVTLTNPYALHWENMVPASELTIQPALAWHKFQIETLKRLGEGTIKPIQEKWELLLRQAEEQDRKLKADQLQPATAQPVVEQTVTYHLPAEKGFKSVTVTVTMQKDLDEELAKKLQEEEYQGFIEGQEQLRLDEELAKRLQEQDDKTAKSPRTRRK
ncbi:hypothetical protein AQUSIP_19690 [Aquicella siphonis]|uniref:Uncharacterized protein n=1 Tax=Aquicella siphonis TaxID=254247 RepID=A0A5E4PK71_9COXI|nr:hypothetical protein [Aquicella siphonis]VVC76646.1 hypothetical protein AQUSIP_19690 [Aquicella siphonis]